MVTCVKTYSTTKTLITISLLFLLSLGYYYGLSAKEWTWLYVSGDSGDWMQFTNWWITPQAFGSPLFISIIRGLGLVFPSADAYQLLTFCLAVLPGAILVVLTYFIGRELTKSHKLGIVAAVVLLGMSIVLTQATVLEQYMLTAVFVAGAFLAYIKNKIAWAVALIGLGSAIHIIVAIIAILWLAVERRHYKLIPLFIVLGVLPYGLILYLMSTDAPPLIAGNLSWDSLNLYLGNTYLVGNLSLASIPKRLLDVGIVTVTMIGFGCYALFAGFKKPRTTREIVAIAAIGCVMWYWFSNTFFSTFKYVVLVAPIIAGYVAFGLARLPKWQTILVVVGAIALIITNSFLYNADKLAKQEPQATELYTALTELPDDTAILTPRGGSYGFVLFYAMSEGYDLTPLLMKKLVISDGGVYEVDRGYLDYLKWFGVNYSEYSGTDSFVLAREALEKGNAVYFISLFSEEMAEALDVEPTGVNGLHRVINVKVESWDAWIAERLERQLSEK
jgi:hypothetical protein